MILDYAKRKGNFVLRVSRGNGVDIRQLQRDHGLEFFRGSPAHEAVLSTQDPYAAVTWFEHATEAARQELADIAANIAASRATDCPAHFPVPDGCELWPFQRADLAYALQRQNTLVGDQPGLGKTCVAIAFANTIRAKRVLVICPASIRLQWASKIRQWSTMPWPYVVHVILHGKRGVHPHAEWTVVSYELASTPTIHQALAAYHYDLLVLDEAHYLKTIDAIRTRAVFGGGASPKFPALAHQAGRTLALSGTPLPNRPREAYTLARNLCFDSIDWMSADAFADRYNPTSTGYTSRGMIWTRERSGRLTELQNRLRAYFMVRHEKHEVLPQLAWPSYDLVYVEETGPVKAALQAERMLDIDPENLSGADVPTLGQIAAVRRMMGLAIAPQACNYIDMLFEGGEEKLVVFAWHIDVLNILETKLARHGLVRVDGSTSAMQRQKRIKRFIEEPDVKLILGNILALGVGTDGLQTVATHCLIAEPDWVPGVNQQAVDRLHRGGQQGRVQADFLVAQGSFAERILATALRKLKVLNQTLDQRNGT
jgi:SWI/SNF-related matrix-associated actin-dependent regulator of chromatin subfamily A-like protein 1